ncbi:MAG: lysophospholipid acyltransferase family protein [Flavobacterium sp.]|nr:lysophospholipid acyltransferase family protein [Flavobacterium sp.]
MQFLLYIILYPILFCISILPFKILYALSDFIYILLYYIFGYRKKTVRSNLKMALSHLSDKERLVIEKKSFQYLCDTFLEMIKTLTISKAEMSKRYVLTNLDFYLELEKKGKSIALMTAHYASYEWAISMNKYIKFKGVGIYKKISNPYFDKLVRAIRSKFKATLITTKETKHFMEQRHIDKQLCLYGFASDQTPRRADNNHWYTFLGIETPIHIGAEIFAKKFDMNVGFLASKRIKRGYYEATIELLSDDVKNVPDFAISELFIKKVEKQIYEAPEFYLWSHKRFKHKK